MFSLFSVPTFVGLEKVGAQVLCATIRWYHNQPQIVTLFRLEEENVKQLYMQHSLLVSGLEGNEVLIRSLSIPLVKKADIEAALAFQAEPIIPYSLEEAILCYQITHQTQDSSQLLLLTTRKNYLQKHLTSWQTEQIEPEIISAIPLALATFGSTYISSEKPFIVIHAQSFAITGVLVQNKNLLASFTQKQEGSPTFAAIEMEILYKQISKIIHSLSKEIHPEILAGVLLTGDIINSSIYEKISAAFHWPLLTVSPSSSYSAKEMQTYAVPIGLALGANISSQNKMDFRQQEWTYPYPWKRFQTPLIFYAVSMFLLSILFYIFGQLYLEDQENQLKQAYVDLLSAHNKRYNQFELAFLEKNPEAKAKFEGEVVSADQLNKQDLVERLNFFQKEVQSTPDTFPLIANTPRVSDVLAWLSQHPVISYQEEGEKKARLQIENFSYVMVKRPIQGKKQDKYQIKIELEFSSQTPTWAREFHDALIAPNLWVDPKGEVKWSSNRGKYKTSFYLKDKTTYSNL